MSYDLICKTTCMHRNYGVLELTFLVELALDDLVAFEVKVVLADRNRASAH